ncbi:MAG: small basic protein [Sedimentisphaerales bacterium]|nr:small basic protein [Sedimentisphaerales bacterium]
MSIDRSLKIKDALERHRNVLSRDERIQKLMEEEKWDEQQSLFGLPKVAHRKTHAGRKAEKEEAATEVEGEALATEETAETPETKEKGKGTKK